jgi:predicted AlkP superfamily phosphohydrolase/phosphomutase
MGRRVMLVGLDCVPPVLAFERYAAHMPNLSRLRGQGAFARLRSTTPPITVPAWAAMLSGRDPGELGLYGFRKRERGSYALTLADSRDVHAERVWDVLAQRGLRSSVIAVPPSSPPFAVAGELVSCFLTPDGDAPHTYPAPLAGALRARFGAYIPDVEVRASAREGLERALVEMTQQHFAIARHLWQSREPDFLVLVEIGPDRLHHAFYAELDPAHPRHDPASEFAGIGERYYALLDRELGALMALADQDTAVLVASDHGARPLLGAFRINEWLQREGLLTLKGAPAPGPLRPELVDWSRSKVWAEGGYYARVFCNVRGREPEGVLTEAELPGFVTRLAERLRAVRGPNGESWNNQVEAPASLYRAVRGLAPDLIAIFAGLDVRPVATVGTGALYAERDDRDADACNHDMFGIFALAGAGVTARGQLPDCEIQDVGATVLSLLGVDKPQDWLGRSRA